MILYSVAMTLADNVKLESVLEKIRSLLKLSATTNRKAYIEITGQGIDPRQMHAIGAGAGDPATEENSQLARAQNRSATFRFYLREIE